MLPRIFSPIILLLLLYNILFSANRRHVKKLALKSIGRRLAPPEWRFSREELLYFPVRGAQLAVTLPAGDPGAGGVGAARGLGHAVGTGPILTTRLHIRLI